MLKLKHLDRALRYEARMNELESRPKVGADGTAHEWDCISPGEYDSLYECRRCGARHMEQLDRLGSDRPRFGCTYNAPVQARPEAVACNDGLEG